MSCTLSPRWSSSLPVMGCLFLLAAFSVRAEDSPTAIEYLQSEYIVDSWQTEQGLPDDQVNGITQTPDGYLWVATFNGLARFNGADFVVFDAANTPELPSSRITDVDLDRKGRLWIRSEYGHLTQWAQGRFQTFYQGNGVPIKGIKTIREDHVGEVWVTLSGSGTNYFRFANGLLEPASSARTFYQRFGKGTDRDGFGWGIHSNRLFSVHPDNPVEVEIPAFTPHGNRVTGSRDGGIWVIAHRFQKFYPGSPASHSTSHQAQSEETSESAGRWEDYGPLPRSTDLFDGFLEDRNGSLWVGTGVGELWRVDTNRTTRRFKLLNSAPRDFKWVFEDAEGNIWIGTWGSGLYRLKARAFKTYDSKDGLSSDVVRSVTQDRDGNIWLAGVSKVDWFPPNGSARVEARGVNVSLPWNVYGSRNGPVWIGTFAHGLFRSEGESGTWFPFAEGLKPPIDVILESRQGEIYVGTPRGLFVLQGDTLAREQPPAAALAMSVNTMVEDSKGRLYVGLSSDGLLGKTSKGWERFTTADGLPGNNVSALCVDDQDNLWIATHGRGFARLKEGRISKFSDGQVAFPRMVSWLLKDDTGHLWFGSNQGLFRANLRELNDLADGRKSSPEITHYDRTDGMGSSQCLGNAWKARDGTLWIGTMNGLTVVDPHSLPVNSRPPPVVIEQALVDDQSSIPTLDSGIKLPPGSHRLEIRYAGLSFTAPSKVRFKYRLHGFDDNWVNASDRRVAYYTKVPPGHYRFQVIAANNDNIWNKTGASLAIVMMPHFWQTGWFAGLAILGVTGLAFGAYELRVTQLKRARVVQEAFSRRLIESQENERKRIAAELHDSLGQSLLVVKNYAARALKAADMPEKVREQLHEISENTSSSIEEVRSIARALRPYQLDRFGLTKTLEDAADLIAKTGSLQIQTQIDPVDNTFAPEAEISIYRVVQEWLNNVVKHAQGSTARLQVQSDGALVRMVMEDNGIGFDYAAVMNRSGSAASFGLINLRERVRLLGGNLKVETAPGEGTRLLVEIPCRK
jgi:signal transduction histidine kinase/ligand-binding sensor domain-containing protein